MTPSQFSALSLKDQAATLKTFRTVCNENRANAKLAKADALIQKRQAKALKQEQAIVKAQLRLQKLLPPLAPAIHPIVVGSGAPPRPGDHRAQRER